MTYRVRKFRAVLFNACNQAQFKRPRRHVVGANFGQVTQAQRQEIQFGLKPLW
jgi:hypothetical protein